MSISILTYVSTSCLCLSSLYRWQISYAAGIDTRFKRSNVEKSSLQSHEDHMKGIGMVHKGEKEAFQKDEWLRHLWSDWYWYTTTEFHCHIRHWKFKSLGSLIKMLSFCEFYSILVVIFLPLVWYSYLWQPISVQIACYFHSRYKAVRSSTYVKNG